MANKVRWSGDVKNDVGEQASLNHQMHEARMHPNPNKRYPQYLKQIFEKDYGYDITTLGIPYLATALKVLSGAGASDSASTGDRNTTTLNPFGMLDNLTMASAGKAKPRVRVIARIPEFDTGLNWPMDEEDFIRLCSHGEYHAENTSPDIDSIEVGDKIWVTLNGSHTSRPDGKAAGVIVGLFSKPRLEDIVDATPSPEIAFRKPCKSSRNVTGAPSEYLRGSTENKPNIAIARISKYKTRIKTGLYGNGTSQTKHHFNAALTKGKNGSYAKSFKGELKGPTAGKEGAFIWVGHLRNNGYLDLLDRPIGPGRETIIYAPMTLDTSSPIEIKYYFHDRAGFGHAWVDGPDTTVEKSINLAATDGNDFREKIAPAIKDMIKERRNFILVIPEMSYSRGYGTKSNNASRTDAMSIGGKALSSTSHVNKIGEKVIRNKITSKEAAASVTNYLHGLPAAKIVTGTQAEGTGAHGLADQVALANVLQKTRLTERETATFDGSFTGGLFGNFHTEILSIVEQHLGRSARENVVYTSIVADGMGAISLASITTYFPNSSTQLNARSSFRGVSIDRIDYIESSKDMEERYNFSVVPAFTFYEEYILFKAEGQQIFEFNYITEKDSSHGKAFFDALGKGELFNNSNLSANSKGSRKFSLNADTKVVVDPEDGDFQALINMHNVPSTEGGDTSKKTGYAFGMQNGLKSQFVPFPPFIFDTNPVHIPINDFVPDHAAKATAVPSEGMVNEYENERNKVANKINKFRNILRAMKNKNKCKDPLLKDYCVSGVVPKDGLLKDKYLLHLKDLHDFYRYDTLLEHESNIAKIIKDREKLTKYLEVNITKQAEDFFQNSGDKSYFDSIFPNFQFRLQLDEGTDSLNMIQAINKLKKPPYSKKISSTTEGANFFVDAGDIESLANNPNAQPPGAYAKVTYALAREKTYEEIKERITKAIEATDPVDSTPVDPECDPSPTSLAEIKTRIIMPSLADNARGSLHGCVDNDISVASNYRQLKSMIDYSIDVDEWTNAIGNKKHTSRETGIVTSTPGFVVDTFKYKTRGKERPVYRKSPYVWSCIAGHIRDSWEAACNVSGYIPFRITSGIKGESFISEQGGVTAYNSGMLVDSFGLAINVDPHITGYSATGAPIYSVFTGMWTPGFVEIHANELYDLGVLYRNPGNMTSSPFGLITTGWETNYYDNAFTSGYYHTQNMLNMELPEGHGSLPAIDMPPPETDDDSLDFGHMTVAPTSDTESGFVMPSWEVQAPEPRLAEEWGGAEDSYTGPSGAGEKEEEYDKYMKSVEGVPIVPPGADPVSWLLTFCERSGMKWGNSFFLRKRFRGGQSWTVAEQKRIAAIYNISDIVARVNSISWPVASVDKHMHFQYYAGAPVIRWNEIKEAR